jgi:2-(1,2-epoxy-1,2-dihydrophenyl)acetyl-CoA isomerase
MYGEHPTLGSFTMSDALETLKFNITDGLATITLSRPDAANAMNPTMARELNQVSILCEEDRTLRAVLINAEGKLFCAGGDISEFVAAGDKVGGLIRQMASDLHLGISRLTRLRAPVIASIQGTAAGAGFSLAIAADVSIAAEQAKFTMAYTNAGLSPDGSSTYFLPRRIGDRRARELMLTNRILTAQEAAEWGVINQAVPAETLDQTVQQLVTQFRQGPTLAYGRVKALLNDSFNQGLETQMELETKGIADTAMTEDGQEGLKAFLEKRQPTYYGR